MDTEQNSRDKAQKFLHEHPLGILSTAANDQPWGAAVYFVTDEQFNFYFITRADTKKYRNLKAHPKAALTIVDEKAQTTVQASGAVVRVPPARYNDIVFHKLAMLRPKGDPEWAPPVIKVHKGDYMVLKLQTVHLQYADFSVKKTDPHSDYIDIIIDGR